MTSYPESTGRGCAGAPAFLAHVPILGGALRGICVRAVKRMVEVMSLLYLEGLFRAAADTLLPTTMRIAAHRLFFPKQRMAWHCTQLLKASSAGAC